MRKLPKGLVEGIHLLSLRDLAIRQLRLGLYLHASGPEAVLGPATVIVAAIHPVGRQN
jgi:hypothetical protein